MKPLLAAGFICVFAAIACHAQTERTFERTLNVSGPVNLDLMTDSGGIEVNRGGSGTVQIHGYLKAAHGWFMGGDGNAEDHIRELERNPPIEQSGNTIRVGYVQRKSLLRGVSMRLVITAPEDTQVRARADSGGIHVTGVRGPVDCKADSGGIEASDIGNEVKAATDSGGIHIRNIHGPVFARADSGGIDALEVAGSVDASTDSGGIRVSQTVNAAVRAHADSGGIHVRLAKTGGYDVRAHSDSGRITVSEMTVHGTISKQRVEGQMRGGGPPVDIQVDSGNIEIE
ncbi:MAG TPA: DUF4097 family beta strand repeat-containing protein [Bryobacteraceae bacterium]|nr:DUF4097 family beta strand repeat-containing protein [Bryobacteraceae bacterium]